MLMVLLYCNIGTYIQHFIGKGIDKLIDLILFNQLMVSWICNNPTSGNTLMWIKWNGTVKII